MHTIPPHFQSLLKLPLEGKRQPLAAVPCLTDALRHTSLLSRSLSGTLQDSLRSPIARAAGVTREMGAADTHGDGWVDWQEFSAWFP